MDVRKNHTIPPTRFNETTLLSEMENPQRYINVDKRSAKTLNETGGLGTVTTRADIIEKLFKSFIIEKKGKAISNIKREINKIMGKRSKRRYKQCI